MPEHFEVWRGADDGYVQPCCCIWICRDPLFDRLFCVNEIYQRGLTAREFARAVLDIDSLYGDREIDGILDSSAWADIGNGSRATEMNALGCNWKPAEKGPGSRVGGIAKIHSVLALKSDGKPGLQIFKNYCPNVIRELQSACYAKTGNPEDTDATSDHGLDALRYALGRKVTSCRMVRVRGLWVEKGGDLFNDKQIEQTLKALAHYS